MSQSGNPSSKSGLARTTSAAKRSGRGATLEGPGAASSGARWPPRAASHRLTRKPQRHWQRSTANKLWARGRPRPDRVRGRPVRIRTTSQESRAGTRRISGPFRRFAPKRLVSSAPVSALELLVRGRPRPHSAPRCGVEGDADGGVRAPDGLRRIEPFGDEPPTRSNWPAPPHPDAAGRQCPPAAPRRGPRLRPRTVAPPNDRARSVGETSPAPRLRDAPPGARRPAPARSRPAALPRRPRRKTARGSHQASAKTPSTPGPRATGR